MQVSSATNSNYSQIINKNNPLQDASQEQRDKLRGVVVDKAAVESKQAKIDIYVASSNQNSTSTSDSSSTSTYQSQQEYVQNYNDFASNTRQANNYATLVENGADLSKLADRPSTLPIAEPASQEQKDSTREAVVGVAGYQSTQSQIEAYQAGSGNGEDSAYSNTAEYIKNYNEFAADARRSSAINTYIDNNALFGVS